MKNIQEKFDGIQSITEYINDNMEANVSEGLKDIFNAVKAKFKKAWEYLKGIVVKAGSYILPVDDNGEVIPAISNLTAGQAYVDGAINTSSTFVKMDKAGAKITGCKTKFEDALKLYGSGDSRKYWLRMLNENNKLELADINEVRLQNADPQAK